MQLRIQNLLSIMKLLLFLFLLTGSAIPVLAQPMVEVTPLPEAQRVDVLVDGEPFTSYIYTDTLSVLKKPVLYPIRSAGGTPVTRYYPMEARAGERADHPHQIGLWFNYGNVDGFDFWNNSDAVSEDRAGQMGTIYHREIEHAESGTGTGILTVSADWLTPDGRRLLAERTTFHFHADSAYRAIDRVTTLTAGSDAVDLADNKEGVLGLRVRRELEMPAGEPLRLTDASGRARAEDVLDDAGVNGHYRNSEGVAGYPDVWGKRAKWTALSGVVDGEPVTIAIFDHPENVGYPTYWHARDYGLFAANPLGQKDLSGGTEELGFALEPGGSVTFRHRIAVFSSKAEDEVIEAAWARFVE